MVSVAAFTSNGSWMAPLLVTNVIVIGCGGGGGGGCADSNFSAGGAGGGGSIQQVAFVTVTALTTYTVTVGSGGAGGYSSGSQSTYCGLDGYPSILSLSGTNLFYAPGGGGAGTNQSGGFNHGGLPWAEAIGGYSLEAGHAGAAIPGSGGGWDGTGSAFSGMKNFLGGFAGGIANVDASSYGAGGGGAGPKGSGGNGGSLASPNGVNAAANTGAGGGGGNTSSTNGGSGGSGYLYIVW